MGQLGFGAQLMATPVRDMFHIKLEGYTLSIKQGPAKYLHDVLESQHSLCRLNGNASFTTTLRSKDRIITIEMSRSNGMLITVKFKDDDPGWHVATGYVQWSDLTAWIIDFHDGFVQP